jgi:UDP-GlcNAc:undecaprenyl-phosphate/decaprenyl-phosphate GlcNAc-1-phosphate transferase
MRTYLFTYSLALILSTVLTPAVIVWAGKRNLVDIPDARKIHSKPIACIGGIAIFCGAMLVLLPILVVQNNFGDQTRHVSVKIAVFLLSSTLMFAIGLYDDLKNARVRTRLVAQFVAALSVCLAGITVHTIHIRGLSTIELGWLSWPITIFWIMGVTNAINLTDGLDGHAAGISGIACVVLAILSVLQGNVALAVIMFALFGSLTGFLFFNFHPAKIFMGDCGSLFLGFTIATTAVLTASKSEALAGIGLPILVLGIPIFDTLISVLRRYLKRYGIMSPDRDHFHHKLIDKGLKQHQVAMIAYLITLCISAVGFLLLFTSRTFSIVLFLSCLVLLLIAFRVAGAFELGQTLKSIRVCRRLNRRKRLEHICFEETRLQLQTAKGVDQWWQCMCTAAKAFDFAQLVLQLSERNDTTNTLKWQNGNNDSTDIIIENILQVKAPIKDSRQNEVHNIDMHIMTNGSLESAGRRATLFTRLVDEFGLGSLEAIRCKGDDRTRDTPLTIKLVPKYEERSEREPPKSARKRCM